MGRLSLSLLGPFEAVMDGRPLQGFRSQKVRALLAYLAAEADRPHPRPVLAGLLWPDLPDSSALANLRTALWNLRVVCGDREASSPLLLISTDTVRFNRTAQARVDLNIFLGLTAGEDFFTLEGVVWPVVARLEEAATLYRGLFLEGFFVDSAPFEEWVLLRQEQTQQRMVQALRHLAAAYEQSGDYERALVHARRHLEVNPWEEEAHQRAMRLLAQLGRRGAALAQYQICRRVLLEELGVEPSTTTHALATAIREGQLEEGAPTRPTGHRQAPLQPPVPATPIFGRESEIREIAALLGDRTRLLSIVGPGGIGKTRLAQEVAQRMVTAFADGAAFVDLTPLSQPEAIVAAIAQALDFPAEGQGVPDLKAQLLQHLRERAILLVLDSFEHLLDGAPLVREMVEAAPGIRVLVTSRERLKLQAEHVTLLQGLASSQWETVAGAQQDPAVQLFLHHAQRVRPSFVLRHEHLQPLRSILELVEGMPLALILAAVWVEVMSPAEIAAELGRSPDFLKAPYRDLPPRQRSLRALFEGTWERLDERERRIFASLSVFRGGFTLQAAQEVAFATARDLLRFVDRSMLSRVEGGRFAIHELFRHFAAGELARSPQEEEEVRERHAAYYCRFLQQRAAAFKDERAEQARAEFAADFENARAAWNWAADHVRVSLLEQAMILGFYCIRQGRHAEGAAMSQRASEKLAETTSAPGHRVLAFLLAAHIAFMGAKVPFERQKEALAEAFEHLDTAATLGEDVRYEEAFTLMILGQILIEEDSRKARSFLEKSLSLFEELEEWYEMANVYSGLADTYEVEADYSAACDYAVKALQLWEMVGERHWINVAWMELGVIKTKLGQVEQGVKEIREALALFESAGNRYYAALAQLTLGETLVSLGRFDEALPVLSRSHAHFAGIARADVSRLSWCRAALHQGHFREVRRQCKLLPANDREGEALAPIAEADFLQGCAALALGDLEEAVALLQASVAGYRALEHPEQLSRALAVSGSARLLSGAGPAARQHLVEALQLLRERQLPLAAAMALSVVSLFLVETGACERAIEIHELARRDPFVANSRWFAEVFGRRLADVAATLPEEDVGAARSRGAVLDLWDTVDELLQELEVSKC